MAKRPAKKTKAETAIAKKKRGAKGKPNLQRGNAPNARLTKLNERFIEEYKIDLNGTKAAIRAGYSESSAHSIACDLLKKPKVAAKLALARAEWADRVGITQDAVLGELAALGFSRASTFLGKTDDGDIFVDLTTITERDSAAIKSIETTTTVTGGGATGREREEITKTKITLHDKRLPLRDIGQHLGMFEGDNKPAGLTINVKEIRIVGVCQMEPSTWISRKFYRRLIDFSRPLR